MIREMQKMPFMSLMGKSSAMRGIFLISFYLYIVFFNSYYFKTALITSVSRPKITRVGKISLRMFSERKRWSLGENWDLLAEADPCMRYVLIAGWPLNMPVSVCVEAEAVVVAVVVVEDVFLVGMLVAPRTAGGRGQSLLNVQSWVQ